MMQQIAWSIKPLGEELGSKLGGSILVQQAFLADNASRNHRKNIKILFAFCFNLLQLSQFCSNFI